MATGAMRKCVGSHGEQKLSWDPDPATNYPGAVVCLYCSFGIPVLKHSVVRGTSEAGYDGLFGIVRVHYVSQDKSIMSMRPRRRSS